MVALDVCGARASPGLHDIRIQRALHQELDRLTVSGRLKHERLGRVLERADELPPNDLALRLRVGHPGQGVRELLNSVHRHQPYTRRCDIVLFNLAPLILTQQTVIDKDAHQLVTDRLVHEGRSNRRIHSARKPADHARRTHLRLDALHLLGNHVSAVPLGGDTSGPVQEVLQHALAKLGVLHLRVPLHPIKPALIARKCGDGC